MSLVTICAGLFCHGREVAQQVAGKLGCRLVDDEELIGLGAAQGKLGPETLARILYGKSSLFDRFGHEQEMAISQLNLAAALLLETKEVVLLGLGGHLIPSDLPQVLRVCLIAENAYRIAEAGRTQGLSQKEARKAIQKADQKLAKWAQRLHCEDPWQTELYDILIPMDKRDLGQAVELILHHASSDVFAPSSGESRAAGDYALAARVQLALAQAGHQVRARATAGRVILEINKRVLRFGRLEQELKDLTLPMEGVKEVEVTAGANSHQADIYRAHDFQAPAKILLVDDEREFVETLSERLMMRDMDAAVVFDGEQALEAVSHEEPEVMVLDLMMPGIDGMEVLHRIKRDHPQVQVVVLTGHGSHEDREACLAAGAFAYLQKPVDIEELSQVMRRAHHSATGAGGKSTPTS